MSGTESEQMAATRKFTVPSSATLSALAMRHGLPWACGAAVCVLASVVLGIVWDARFFIVALIVVFLLAPPAMAFLYFCHGLRPATALNGVEHAVAIDGPDLVVTVWPPRTRPADTRVFDPAAERRALEQRSQRLAPNPLPYRAAASATEEKPSAPEDKPRQVRFPRKAVRPYSVGLSSVTVPLRTDEQNYGFLILPLSAFPSPEAMKQFLQDLTAR